MLATCICLNGSLLDQLSCTIVYLHNLFTCTFGRINMSVCLSVCLLRFELKESIGLSCRPSNMCTDSIDFEARVSMHSYLSLKFAIKIYSLIY